MDWLRSKELRLQLSSIQQWIQTSKSSKYHFHYKSSVHVPTSIWEDIRLEEWLQQHLPLQSYSEFATALIKAPIDDVTQLKQRQVVLNTFKTPHPALLSPTIEADLQWFLSTPVIDKNYLFKVLFPGSWYLKWVKLHPELLRLYQWYSVYFTTTTSLLYPISILFGPFWILRVKMGFPLSLKGYFEMLFKLVKLFKTDLKQLGVLLAYCGFYLYSLIQNIDLSFQLHRLRSTLLQKIQCVYQLVQRVKRLGKRRWWAPFDEELVLEPLDIRPNLFWAYRLLGRPDLQARLFGYFKVAVMYDTLHQIANIGYPLIRYGSQTYFHHMCNPALGKSQVANPLKLQKGLIVSGPNAGGKTTYVKSLLWNILLGQSFGIAYCSTGALKPYDAILHHHRVKDVVGDQSLFQAEMAKIKEALVCLKDCRSVIYFMDEPLHSTHPIDGAAMLKAVLYYLGTQDNCSVIVTSHYFSIQTIPGYTNVSVRAVMNARIYFDYKIYPGPSQQTIGIELLRQDDFPARILESAVKLKNKIYARTINV